MGKSSLTQVTVLADASNYTKGRSGKKIKAVTIHHMAGVLTAEQCGKIFQTKGRNGSSHYGIGDDGKIGNYVDENNTAWTNSNWNSNCESVTIETSNSQIGGDWKVSTKALNSLIKLVADIAKRNNLGTLVSGTNLTWHSMYANTTCPGNYLRSKIKYIADEANKINNQSSKKVVSYRVYSNNAKRWFDTTSNGKTAGNQKDIIGGIQIKTNYAGKLKYKAHIKGGKWLKEVTKWDDTDNGYAGIKGKPIDAIMFASEKGKVSYRVKTKKSGWLPWVSGYNTKNSANGYAGNFGEEITAVQIKIS